MSCYRPLSAYQDDSGGVRIGTYHSGEQGRKMELPCGHCVGCRMERSRSWSIRVMHEAQLYDSNLFVTFDYAPEHLPKSLSLEYVDFQGFLKRLRKRVVGVNRTPDGRRPIRFFVAGEYGAKYQRPHWHAVLFNCRFPDQERYVNGTYRSSLAESLWGKGNVVIGEVTARSAAYCAGYTLSKVYGRDARSHYEDVVNLATGEVTLRRPEFCVMSRRPGIGAWWYEKFSGDVFPGDFAVAEGRKYKVPSYYWRKFQGTADAVDVEDVAARRYERARVVPVEESSDERRAIREEVATARLMLFGERDH